MIVATTWIIIVTFISTGALAPVQGFGNFVLPKNIFGMNSLFTNDKETPQISTGTVRSNIEAQVRSFAFDILTYHDGSSK